MKDVYKRQVVRRAGAENRPAELSEYSVVKDIKELKDVDVAIFCTPTRSVEKYAKEILALGFGKEAPHWNPGKGLQGPWLEALIPSGICNRWQN